MGIEKDLSRIADALEELLVCVKGKDLSPARSAPAKPSPTVDGAPKQSTSAIPGTEAPRAGISSFTPPGIVTPLAPTSPVVAPVNAPSSPEELRRLAQTIAQKAGSKTLAFTQWVNELLVPYGVKTIVTVPADKFGEVAAKMIAWAKKEGING